MAEPLSPLGAAYRPGRHGNPSGEPGVTLSETRPGSIVQLACWPGREDGLAGAVRDLIRLELPLTPRAGAVDGYRAIFGVGLRRWLVVDQPEGLAERLAAAITSETGTVTDLSHARTAFRIEGSRAEWVLSKLFAIDFDTRAFAVGSGVATMHHDIFASIQRTGENAFDIYVFRSFARSFWTTLGHASEEVGVLVR